MSDETTSRLIGDVAANYDLESALKDFRNILKLKQRGLERVEEIMLEHYGGKNE